LQFDLPVTSSTRAKEQTEPPQPPAREERILTEQEWRALERENLQRALEQAGGRISGPGGAAELLGIHPNTLASRLEKLGIRRKA
jgi:transcriptional regulator with GAF, ATPase, and Fis domain